MRDEDAKYLGERKIREKIADYRRSADIARRQIGQTHVPEVRESYRRMVEGFEKLAGELEHALNQQSRWAAMQIQSQDDEGKAVRGEQAALRKT